MRSYFLRVLATLAIASLQLVHGQEPKLINKDVYVVADAAASKLLVIGNKTTIQEIPYDSTDTKSVRFIDFNFDGSNDIQIFRERGTEEYFDIYLFDSHSKQFVKNLKLSELPCPIVNKDKKFVIGSCFKASACDRWEEAYRWVKNDLNLVEKIGTYCDPSTSAAYAYRETYSGNRLIKKTVRKHKPK